MKATEQYFPVVLFIKLCKVGVNDSYSLQFDFDYFDLIMYMFLNSYNIMRDVNM